MKQFAMLYRREFSLRIWQGWLFFLAALLSQPILTEIAAVQMRYGTSFMQLYDLSAAPVAVIVLLALAAGWMVYSVLRDFKGGMDCLLTLPVRREKIYLAKMAAFASMLLVLFAGFLGGVFLSFGVYSWELMDGIQPVENGLLLAFCENRTLRQLLPPHFAGVMMNLLLLGTLAAGMYYLALLIHSRKFQGILLLGAAGLCWVKFLTEQQNMLDKYPTLFWGLGLVAAVVCMVWHSLRMLRRADI